MNRITRRALLGFTALALALVLWHGLTAAPAELAKAPWLAIRDDRGVQVEFSEAPKRVISLLPSLTESICALDACGQLVGVDRYSNWPGAVNALPKLGGLTDLQVEALYALKPDVVFAARSARALDRLEGLGIKVVALESETRADFERALGVLARVLQRQEQAVQLLGELHTQVQAVRTRIPARWRGAKVYFEVSSEPYAAGAASFIGQLMAGLDLVNVVPADLGPFPKLNPEFVVRTQPEVIMASAAAIKEIAARPGWDAIPAVANGQFCGFGPAQNDVLVRAGPRMAEAAAHIADCLQHLTESASVPSAPQ